MKDLNMIFAGFGGQGVLFAGKVVAYAGLIEGRELRVGVLDVKEGTVTVDGHIDSIYYRDEDNREGSRGLLGRLFHG